MILCDSNVWLALTIDNHAHHNVAEDWLGTIAEASSVHFCRATQHSFLRLLTLASVFTPFGDPPLTNNQAWDTYEALLADDRIAFQHREPAGLEARWKEFAVRGMASPKLWIDAYLAAFARAGGCQMVTTDAGFAQSDGLDLLVLGSLY